MSRVRNKLIAVMAWPSFSAVPSWFVLAAILPYLALNQPVIWIRLLCLLPFVFVVVLSLIDPDIWQKIADYEVKILSDD